MSETIQSVSISELKARLSEHLRRVKAGASVLITERGRPIGMMTPLPREEVHPVLAELAESGLVRLASRSLDADFWKGERPADKHGAVRRAILDERAEGR